MYARPIVTTGAPNKIMSIRNLIVQGALMTIITRIPDDYFPLIQITIYPGKCGVNFE